MVKWVIYLHMKRHFICLLFMAKMDNLDADLGLIILLGNFLPIFSIFYSKTI
jgi:hypothetical protein